MAFDSKIIRFLIKAKVAGVNFSKTITIGRQNLTIDPALDREALIKELKKLNTVAPLNEELLLNSRYADQELLPLLGAKQIDSIDKSKYENATIVYDLNNPLSSKYKNKYDVVIDSGSLEHIFNFPTAMRNCMELVKKGGTLFIFTPANNYLGHGFYQFSPEIFYRVLSGVNGFKVEKMLLQEMIYKGNTYEALDPDKVNKRVDNLSNTQLLLFIQAKKISKTTGIKIVYQSDYVKLWRKPCHNPIKTKTKNNNLSAIFKKLIPQYFYRKLYNLAGSKKGTLLDKDLFKKLS